jgi:formylglycine-generating enzyme required for sulfatase activity
MISDLINILKGIGIEPDAVTIADMLWLAHYMDEVFPLPDKEKRKKVKSPITKTESSGTDISEECATAPAEPEKKDSVSHIHDKMEEDIKEKESSRVKLYPLTEKQELTETTSERFPFRTPGAEALPSQLEIGRSLRPFMRKVPSSTRLILDEEATVTLSAETDTLMPVLIPESSYWLDVVMVVDESPSMIIWQETIAELKSLLERHGAFRNVQVWGFLFDRKRKKLRLHSGTGQGAIHNATRNPQELIDPKGQRLILIISDYTAPFWHENTFSEVLKMWTEKSKAALVQMLPYWLWERSGLSIAERVYLRAVSSEVVNSRLEIEPSPFGFEQNVYAGIKLPIITLEPRSLLPWAKSLAGMGGMWIPGVVFQPSVMEKDESEYPESSSAESLTPEKRVALFRSSASPEAQKLASYLAAAPLTLPVMRLVQKEMLPQSQQIHLSEIFLSGLLRRKSPTDETIHPHKILYEFEEGVRELLIKMSFMGDTIDVISLVYKRLSLFIDKRTGAPLDFCSVIYNPSLIDKIQVGAAHQPFASVATSVLRCLGGTYAEIADRLEEHLSIPQKDKIPVKDFIYYLKHLREETGYIDVRGLIPGKSKAPKFLIDALYIPFKINLQEVLKEPRLFIKGAPGSGKTTLLRLIANSLCRKILGEEVKFNFFNSPVIPVLIHVGKLSRYMDKCGERKDFAYPETSDSPEWLLHYLESESRSFKWKISAHKFQKELEQGRCIILLDGLDEAPNKEMREQISGFALNVSKVYPKCQIVMTVRSQAISDKILPDGFHVFEIAPFDDSAIDNFLDKWCAALYGDVPERSRQHKDELKEALKSRPRIYRMARTPVMLIALAVVHWNGNRLPEQRAELYESILMWLFRSRAEKEGRKRKLLQKLALAMFMHPDGRQKQVGLRWAAERLQGEFKAEGEANKIEEAENFLHGEMVDSGVIVERELRLEYWHLSFQEYLAAYEIGGMSDDNQVKTLFHDQRLYQSEWREVVLLLGGVLYKQGDDKINNLINRIIKRGPTESSHTTLPELAKEVALLGGIVQDLSPYNFEPRNPRYKEIIQSVMGIFDKKTFRNILVQVRIDAADALGRAGDPRFHKEDNLWVHIPAGRFRMGAQSKNPHERNYDKDAYDDESPVHEVELSEYWISKYPVTVEQYKLFVDDEGYKKEKFWEAGGFGKFKEPGKWGEQLQYPTRPVVNVSWYEAKAYAAWSGCRLPTEAQWERAARGSGEEYRKYPWGNEEPDKETLNYYESGIEHPSPVGIFPESCSPEGVIDMAGNVWEWCEDWFGDYPSKPIVDPTGFDRGDDRVLRGGSWFSYGRDVRSALRIDFGPDLHDDDTGFRLARGQK